MDSQGGYVSKLLYVEMKESGPLGGACTRHAPSRSANVMNVDVHTFLSKIMTLHNITSLLVDWQLRGCYFMLCSGSASYIHLQVQ